MLIIIGLCLALAGCGSSAREEAEALRRQNAELANAVSTWKMLTVGALALGGIMLVIGCGMGSAKGKDDE